MKRMIIRGVVDFLGLTFGYVTAHITTGSWIGGLVGGAFVLAYGLFCFYDGSRL
jgi:hypothetical protein